MHADDWPATTERLTRLVAAGEPYDGPNRMRRADGEYRWFRARMVPSWDANGNIVRYCSIQTDVHDLRRAQDLLAGERRVLEMVAGGHPLSKTLEALCHLLEEMCSGCLCSVLTVSGDGTRLQVGARPSLPPGYTTCVDGLPIDAAAGPSSLAIYQEAARYYC